VVLEARRLPGFFFFCEPIFISPCCLGGWRSRAPIKAFVDSKSLEGFFAMTEKPKAFAHHPRFYSHLGWFYAAWTSLDLTIDYAIHKCLKISPEQTHQLVSGMEFGKKVALLRSLLNKSDYENGPQLKGFLTKFTKESLRNVFTHSFIASDHDYVSFVHRTSFQGEYSCTVYKFDPDGFVTHVKKFVQLASDFEKALGLSPEILGEFAGAAADAAVKASNS
jgi:hypothetical protein